MSSTARKELFTERAAAGARTYFLDVKESQKGELYLVISESRTGESGYEHSRIMIFEDHLEPFIDGLRNAIMFCRKAIAGAKTSGQGPAAERGTVPPKG